ncbi:MAG TPA: 3-dehydroquinate synthase [Desulfuromonadaceae bacterium]|jgi:3-dehydroquinate synthase
MSSLTVSLGENSYDILIESGSLASLGPNCAALGLCGQVAVITNPTVFALFGQTVEQSLKKVGNQVTVITIQDGEEYKNTATLNYVYDRLIEAGLDRTSFVVALGGGVVGDLAGFAAATYLRGVPFVQVPTTLLAQVDSSVGGKTAIDHPHGKNLIGAFYQPKFVLIDVETLATLPEREFKAGMAEVIKYGVAVDFSFFEFLEHNHDAIHSMNREQLIKVIYRCCEIKAQVVELDEKEAGLRAVLNYGHTLGHALETLAGYKELVHGEAIAIGMALAVRICIGLGYCSPEDGDRIVALIKSFGLPVTPPPVERHKLLEALCKDKKVRNGSVTFICNSGIGNYVEEKLSPEQLLTLSGLEV